MRDLLEQKLARYEELERDLMNPEVLSNPARITSVAREHGSLGKLAKKYRKFKQINGQMAEAQQMIDGDDAEMRELAEAEMPKLRTEREAMWTELLEMTVGGEDATRSRLIMEIRAGTGGDEAALFARDLFEMYRHHAEVKGWKTEILAHSPTELGGFKDLVMAIEGRGVIANSNMKAVATACNACRIPKRRVAFTHRLLRSPCCPNPKKLKSISSLTTIVSTRFARAALVANTSIKPPPPCGSRILKPESWSSARTKRVSSRTRTK